MIKVRVSVMVRQLLQTKRLYIVLEGDAVHVVHVRYYSH